MVQKPWSWRIKLQKVLNNSMSGLLKLTVILGICTSLFIACDKEEAQIPSYINVDHFDLVTGTAEGSNSHKISVVWITVGTKLIGPFDLPCTVPILQKGVQEITLKAGVRMNGIAALRMIYPPYDVNSAGSDVLNENNEVISTVNLVPDSVIHINARAKYNDNVSFLNIEAFEGIGLTMDTLELKDTTRTPPVYTADLGIISDSTLVFEGEKSGKFHLNQETDEFVLRTVTTYDIPETFGATFIELNYKNEDIITVGYVLKGEFGEIIQSALTLNPSEDWNKVYVSINPLEYILKNDLDIDSFYIYIRGVLSDDKEEADIYLDNIKLITE